MVDKTSSGRDFRDIAKGFGVCTIAVLFVYILTGMNAVNMREAHSAALITVFTVCCIFYLACVLAMKASFKYLSLLSAIPLFGLYYLVFMLTFNAAERRMIVCLKIMEMIFMWGGLGTLFVSLAVLFLAHRLTAKDVLIALLAAGFVIRTVMVLFTPLNFFQHDVSNFSGEDNCFHDDYILFIYNHFAIPDGDVRDYGMFYHPPLHYLISAVLLKIQNALPVRFSTDINGLKMLPMLWTSYLILFALKILEWFELKGKALLFSIAMIIFCPQMIFLAIQVNNDALALMLFAASFFAVLKWYSKPELTTIIFLALSIGCAMMSKLSMGFIAFPVAWIFLAKFMETMKAAKGSKDRKAGNRLKDLIKQFALFAVTVFPLGLWFPLRNLISYGTPVTYVYKIDSSAQQDVYMYSLWERFMAPSKELLKYPFLRVGGTVNDFNIPLALVKTGLFDERKSLDNYLIVTGHIMLAIAYVFVLTVIVLAVAGARRRFIKNGRKLFADPARTALWIMAAVLILPEILFCFTNPVVCTQSFRYIAPVLVPAAYWSGSIISMSEEDKSSKALKAGSWCFMIISCLFVISVLLFYGPFAQYSLPWEFLIAKSA